MGDAAGQDGAEHDAKSESGDGDKVWLLSGHEGSGARGWGRKLSDSETRAPRAPGFRVRQSSQFHGKIHALNHT